nr:MAG TPA: hypothetical protein [Caudoviricetes sp.]
MCVYVTQVYSDVIGCLSPCISRITYFKPLYSE